MEEYRKTEDRFFLMLYDYIGFLSALKINRAGVNSLSVILSVPSPFPVLETINLSILRIIKPHIIPKIGRK